MLSIETQLLETPRKKKNTQMLDEPKHMIVKEISSAYEWKAKDLKS